jgi:asparagine synthase (glutamine-hydrolysing)
MCGIAGYIDFLNKTSEDVLTKMTNELNHRGPDGGGTEMIQSAYAQIGLGHRRLAIIDLTSSGHQPMQYGPLWITYNGEIYNFKEIRIELEALGHSFNSHSDTEVILHAYKEWGKDCLKKFVGMFVFVIYDQTQETIFCARDRAGVKPLYYYFKNGLFLFASELKSFHINPGFEKNIDSQSVAAYMQYGNVPHPYCIFKDTYKLKAGHFLQLDLASQKIETTRYWNVYDYYNQPKLAISFEEAKIETEKILENAFTYRMISDVPVGIFLSGGYDSACVTSLLQKNNNKPLKTFTIGVPDIGLNEAPFAKEIAHQLGTDHHEFYCTEKESLEMIDELPYFYDEPFGDSSAIPTMLVSRMARKEVTVALSADAGDEIFAGYNRYEYLLRYREKLNKIPGIARKSLAFMMDQIPSSYIPLLRNKYNFHNRYEKLKGILADPSEQRIMLSLSQQFTDTQMKSLVKFKSEHLATAYLSDELQSEFHTSLSYMMAIDYQTYLLDDILQKVDRATMSASLEGREPFLDHRIIEWAARLPDSYKYKQGEKKYVIKEIVHQYIPKEMMERPKMGFAIPIKNWLSNQLLEHVETYLSETVIKNQGLFNWEVVEKLKKDFLGGKKEYDQKIWYLLMFQMWYKKWMN